MNNHHTSHDARAASVDEAIHSIDNAIGHLHDMVINLEETKQPAGLVDAWHEVIKQLTDARVRTTNLAR